MVHADYFYSDRGDIADIFCNLGLKSCWHGLGSNRQHNSQLGPYDHPATANHAQQNEFFVGGTAHIVYSCSRIQPLFLYRLLNNTDEKYFFIDESSSTGTTTLYSKREFDYEVDRREYQLLLRAESEPLRTDIVVLVQVYIQPFVNLLR